MAWVLDLDGVVWLGDEVIEGSPGAVDRLRAAGERLLFITNNSSLTVGQYTAKLERMGIAVAQDELVTSAEAAASLLAPGSTALVCAGPGVDEALERRGVHSVRAGAADVVVVGWHRDFDFERLTIAARAVMGGARLVGTNDDPTYPSPDGPLPGCGAILAAVATAAGVRPEVAGKPYDAMVELVRHRVGGARGVMAGDRPSTDGLLARRLGLRFGLVLSGVTTDADLPVDPAPDVVAPNLASLVERELGSQ